ncbi:carbohydrate-binding module family 12 [Fusarium beomiforme]|uniref:Carbohydrate-binding module family 12 n=1 Tax=Fusarium beomiforme TaxID=44412 RepID=A0A9P5E2W1_9HYPO|nr:carbohydrate-binding module family 12 [Fusarium beomiforme]
MSEMPSRASLSFLFCLFLNTACVYSQVGVLQLTIERIKSLSNFDGLHCIDIPIIGTVCVGSEADFYGTVTIDGHEETSGYVEDKDDTSPNWKFSKVVDLSKGAVTVTIEVRDKDGFLRFDDDLAHVNPQGGDNLPLQVIPSTFSSSACQITGPISGSCGDHLVARGNIDDRAEIHFRIEILDISTFPFLDWDLAPADPFVSAAFDTNHLLFNPRWGWQTKSFSAPLNFDDCSSVEACTQQLPTKDYPDWSIPFVCHSNIVGRNGDGHLNWEVVTYKGVIHWEGHESPTFGDDDYNFNLDTPPTTNGFGSGATRKSPHQIHLEMKASETIDHFGNTPYWKRFRDMVDAEDKDPADIGGKEAISIGLIGLDRVHPPSGSELHPLYALAVHTQTDLSDDRWAIFARNFGNEGMCSSDMHYADFRLLTFELPRPAGASPTANPIVLFRDFWGNNLGTVDVFTGPGQATFVRFHLNPTPNNGDEGDRVSGELHLRWVGPGARRRSGPVQFELSNNETFADKGLSARADDEGEPEAVLKEFYNSLTPEQKETYQAMFPPVPPRTDDGHQHAVNFLTGSPAPATAKPPLFSARNPLQEQQQRAILSSFCGAFGGHLPANHQASCADFPPFTRLVHTGQRRSNGWYTDPVTVTLIPINANGKGNDHTEYQINSQGFTRYSTPFTLPQGDSTVSYRSQDRAGTLEETKKETFRVDTIAPQSSLAIGQPQYAPGPPVVVSSMTPLTLTGTDSGSGVLSVAYRFYLDGTVPGAYTTVTSGSVQFKLSGPDGIYGVDTLVTDVAGNTFTQSQKLRLSHVADLAVLGLDVVKPPAPFVVVDAPVQVTVRTTVSNLGFVNPVDATLKRSVVDTANIAVTPKDATEVVSALVLDQSRAREHVHTVACLRKSSNEVTFTSEVELSGSPGTVDNDLSNNRKSVTIRIVCKEPWRPGVSYKVGDEVVFQGLVYVCRQPHTSQTGWEPPVTYALWQRTPVVTSEGIQWAPQVIYQAGDVVVFEGDHFRAIQGHQSLEYWTPPTVPALWQRID